MVFAIGYPINSQATKVPMTARPVDEAIPGRHNVKTHLKENNHEH
jgi:hypothetical protein